MGVIDFVAFGRAETESASADAQSDTRGKETPFSPQTFLSVVLLSLGPAILAEAQDRNHYVLLRRV